MIKRIPHGLWFDLIYIQPVVCFWSPRQHSGIENTNSLNTNHIKTTIHGRAYIYRKCTLGRYILAIAFPWPPHGFLVFLISHNIRVSRNSCEKVCCATFIHSNHLKIRKAFKFSIYRLPAWIFMQGWKIKMWLKEKEWTYDLRNDVFSTNLEM